jgi:hypothetical protein
MRMARAFKEALHPFFETPFREELIPRGSVAKAAPPRTRFRRLNSSEEETEAGL